jgi:flagellar motor switch/type III secretory pathway protein FliN
VLCGNLFRFICNNGLSIAFTPVEGLLCLVCAQPSICLICKSNAFAQRWRNGNWTARGRRAMNTVTNLAVPAAEARLAPGPSLVDKHQERDPSELLPWLPCTLVLEIPVIGFKVGDLLGLTNGSIVETAYHQSSDLPLRVNGQLVGWTEFEVVGERLAVRLTDLS